LTELIPDAGQVGDRPTQSLADDAALLRGKVDVVHAISVRAAAVSCNILTAG
jgi:hypothetical protein